MSPSSQCDFVPADDELWMEEALRAARRAAELGEVPIGAVVVCAGQVVGGGGTRTSTERSNGTC